MTPLNQPLTHRRAHRNRELRRRLMTRQAAKFNRRNNALSQVA
jgi:hypothetical protein